ncbi:O-antigen ligase family protein [Nitrospinaceae bacterium]|nr:O-antigen ligase family protein [Nitrospinaceae bacterium]
MKQSFPIIDKMLTVTLFLFAASSMFSISITQISAGLGGSLWLLRSHLADTWKEQRWPLVVPILLFALASLVAVANAYDVSYSFKSLKKLLEFLIFFWVLNCIRENNLRNSLSIVLISSATLSGLLGLYQYWEDFDGSYQNRIEGSLSTYMTFAGLLMLSGLIALAWAMFQKQTQRWVWVPIVIITSCLLLTLTRQAWFGFLTALVFLIFFWRKKVLLLLPIILLITYIASPVSTQKRIYDMFSGKDATFEMRVALWKGGWKIFKDYPLTGCGFKCVDLVISQYPDPTGYVERFRGMHNNLIQVAVDAGVLGLTTWLGIWFCFFRLLYHKATALERNIFERWTIFGSSAAVLAFLAGGLFETNFYDSEVSMLLYFIMALPFSGPQYTSKAVVET